MFDLSYFRNPSTYEPNILFMVLYTCLKMKQYRNKVYMTPGPWLGTTTKIAIHYVHIVFA